MKVDTLMDLNFNLYHIKIHYTTRNKVTFLVVLGYYFSTVVVTQNLIAAGGHFKMLEFVFMSLDWLMWI